MPDFPRPFLGHAFQLYPVFDLTQVGGQNNDTIGTVATGTYREGFVDPATGTLRRLPLEILRVGKSGSVPVYGAARNTKVRSVPGAFASSEGGLREIVWSHESAVAAQGKAGHGATRRVSGRVLDDGAGEVWAFQGGLVTPAGGESFCVRRKECIPPARMSC